jgi:hypothetical protein
MSIKPTLWYIIIGIAANLILATLVLSIAYLILHR